MRCTYVITLLITASVSKVSSNEANYTVKKCSCEWYQIQVENGSCVDHNTTYIHLWDSQNQTGKDIHLSEVPNVVVTPLICPPRQEKVVIQGFVVILTDGKIFLDLENSTSNYCIENAINADGFPDQRHEYCVSYEPFHLCCLPNETMSNTGVCGEPHQPFPISYDYIVQDVFCGKEKPAHEAIALDDNIVTLKDIFGYYSESRNNNSCILSHVADGVTNFYRRFCECEGFTCIEKCCSTANSYYVATSSCESSLDIYNPVNLQLPESNIKSIQNSMLCNESFILDFSDTNYTILSDGTLFSEVGTALPLHSFCLSLVTDLENTTRSTGIGCFIQKPEPACMWRFTIIKVFLIISSTFIVLTIVVYLCVKELRNRTGGACLISELTAMLISQINLIVIQTSQENFSPGGCLAAGVIELIFILSSFFWLNIICFDMWNTFRSLKAFSPKLLNTKLFLKYSLYAWGIPFFIGMVVIAVELLDLYPRPNFKINKGCFFTSSSEDLKAQWIYLYSFMVILLLTNTFFFVHVIIKLLPMRKEQKRFVNTASKKGHKDNSDIESAKLYGKLFIIMGLPWIIEAFSSFGMQSHECYIWVFDIINLTRGIFIFYIFVCLKSTRKKVMHSWKSTKPTTESSDSDKSRKTSAISLSSWLPSRKVYHTSTMQSVKENME